MIPEDRFRAKREQLEGFELFYLKLRRFTVWGNEVTQDSLTSFIHVNVFPSLLYDFLYYEFAIVVESSIIPGTELTRRNEDTHCLSSFLSSHLFRLKKAWVGRRISDY